MPHRGHSARDKEENEREGEREKEEEAWWASFGIVNNEQDWSMKKRRLCARRRKLVFILEGRSTRKCNALLVSQRHFCSSLVEYKYDLLHLETQRVSSERRKWGCRGVRISAWLYSTGTSCFIWNKHMCACLCSQMSGHIALIYWVFFHFFIY